jgi:hypothetical protein
MGKTFKDKPRNFVTREMIKHVKNSVHMDKKRRLEEEMSQAEIDNFNITTDEAGNVIRDND